VLGQATGTVTHKTHHGPDLREATTFPHIVFFAPLCGGYIKMALFPETPKLESRNCPEIVLVGVPKLSRNCPGWSPEIVPKLSWLESRNCPEIVLVGVPKLSRNCPGWSPEIVPKLSWLESWNFGSSYLPTSKSDQDEV